MNISVRAREREICFICGKWHLEVEQTQGGGQGEVAARTRLEGTVKALSECMVGTSESWQVGRFGPEVGVRHEDSDHSTADKTVDYSEWCAVGIERTGVQRVCSDYS